jgi:hypothetical protein
VGVHVTEGYATCPTCGRLKHVTAQFLLRSHNRFEARGAVVDTQRCPGSGAPSVESAEPTAS